MSRSNKPTPRALADALTDHSFGTRRGGRVPGADLLDENWLMNWGGGTGDERPGRGLTPEDERYERMKRKGVL